MKPYIKNTLGAMAVVAAALSAGGCSDFTDIDAKGNNLLQSVNDLELLLNVEYTAYNNDLAPTDLPALAGASMYVFEPLAPKLMATPKTAFSILNTWDEAGHDNELPGLTNSDPFYANCYQYIGKIANPILSRIDKAEGDDTKRLAVKAEAYVVRAFFHYLIAQKFAPAYNPATSTGTLCPPYRTEADAVTDLSGPTTLEDFYGHIISDIDAALALNSLPPVPLNQQRFGLASAYAVKALALMGMQRFEAAADAAAQAIGVNGTITDYSSLLGPDGKILRPKLMVEEDYFAPDAVNFFTTYFQDDLLEPGSMILENVITMNDMYAQMGMVGIDTSLMLLGVPGYRITFDTASSWPQWGLRSTQMYLILAEAALHAGNIDAAMAHLDKIRVNRINPLVYAPLQGNVSDMDTAISMFKSTSFGETIYSMWIFVDRKRWGQVDGWKETFRRNVCGIDMELTPDSHLWTFPIPQNVSTVNPNLPAYLNW